MGMSADVLLHGEVNMTKRNMLYTSKYLEKCSNYLARKN